jgi:pimeloyl-ACP methyl ester carboxylesterase
VTPTTPPESPIRLDVGVASLAAWYWGGDAKSPLVVGVHDLAANGLWWADLAAAGTGRMRFAALDLRGRSGSWSLGASASLAQHRRDVQAVADAVGAPTFAVAGHGTGAAVALEVAAASPERVRDVVLLDGPSAAASLVRPPSGTRDPALARVGATYAHRDLALGALLDGGWLPEAGLSRNARRALDADVAGSGFAWQVRVDASAVERDLTELERWRPPDMSTRTVLVRAANGHHIDDPPLALAFEAADALAVPTTHAGLLLDASAVAIVADLLASTIDADP